MTKTIRPDRVMAELIGTNYVRSLDDAIMVEHEPGCFESDSKSRKRVSEEDVKDVKPPVRTKPKRCNLEISRARIDLDTLARTRVTILGDGVSLRKARIDAAKTPFCDNVSSNETHGKKLIWSDATERWNIADLAEPASYRVILECYRVERPEKDYPEHTLWPRLPRNRGGPEKHLQSFWEYRNLNQSTEPLQSNWDKADNDNYAEREESDPVVPSRGLDAEREMRPSHEEMADRWNGVKYDTRRVRTSDIRLSEDGYLCNPIDAYREMKIPVSGDVEVLGFHKRRTLAECEAEARKSLGINATKNRIARFVERELKPKVLNIADVDKSRTWAIVRIGDLFFAPDQTTEDSKGALTHYIASNGKKTRAKDEYGSPYGPESMGSDEKYWKPLHPRTTPSNAVKLTPAVRAKNRVELMTHQDRVEVLEAFRLFGKPANDNIKQPCGLPYKVDSYDELQFGYANGASYVASSQATPFDDVVERKQTLAAVNARLSPEARRVASMVVSTDETETLAQNYTDIGDALATGRKPALKTLERRGKKIVKDASDEIGEVLQELAA